MINTLIGNYYFYKNILYYTFTVVKAKIYIEFELYSTRLRWWRIIYRYKNHSIPDLHIMPRKKRRV